MATRVDSEGDRLRGSTPVTTCTVAAADERSVNRDALSRLAEGHRREERTEP
ncbi:MAG: hypothetical protein ACR2LE_04895 [Nocardioidaceae bacterium]